jgi:outer membrane lipase/esterase
LSLLVPFGAWAMPYSSLVVFGDSLSDAGNVSLATAGTVPGAPYFAGRFSNGPNYADDLAVRLGLSNAPSLAGGTDYAFGGARTNSQFISPSFGILGQVNGFVSSTPMADPNALYVVFGGANDIQDAIGASVSSGLGTGQSMVLAAVANIGSALQSLAADGALKFLVPNTPNLALVPRVSELGIPPVSAIATNLALLFNSALASELDTLQVNLGIDITRFDTFSVLQDVADHPADYGISNVTDRCYTGDDINFSGGGAICASPDQYLFWDGIHPTAQMHAVLAAGMARALGIPEPGTMLLLLLGLCAITYARIVTRRGFGSGR